MSLLSAKEFAQKRGADKRRSDRPVDESGADGQIAECQPTGRAQGGAGAMRSESRVGCGADAGPVSLLPAKEFAQKRGADKRRSDGPKDESGADRQVAGCRPSGRAQGGAGAMRSKSRAGCGTDPDPEAVLSAKEFARWVVRLVLEVLDHRRLVTHMASVADARIVAALRTMVNTDVIPGRGLGVAVPGRVTVRMVDAKTAEVCAGYDRGPRHFALAARITRTRGQWRLTALRVR
ncbi:hypothetical protein AW168_32060 [Nocardia brasiliensis]|uniref:Uncharacterized protein n=2 Tax=Nocardia brasiliensis TaxID=37326 RepID=K0EL74_NOCB7|nr:hypothetical protein O3I_011285 [Nocardia brasiliensis ATCC 700358]OCF86394.1 hypothetical protein AW168_32060 [Nocardia brasiliensis]